MAAKSDARLIEANEINGNLWHMHMMPCFHINLHNHQVDASDEDGHDLPNFRAAHAMALAGIREFIGHEAMNGTLDFRGRVDITDDAGVLLETIRFVDAFEFKGL